MNYSLNSNFPFAASGVSILDSILANFTSEPYRGHDLNTTLQNLTFRTSSPIVLPDLNTILQNLTFQPIVLSNLNFKSEKQFFE